MKTALIIVLLLGVVILFFGQPLTTFVQSLTVPVINHVIANPIGTLHVIGNAAYNTQPGPNPLFEAFVWLSQFVNK